VTPAIHNPGRNTGGSSGGGPSDNSRRDPNRILSGNPIRNPSRNPQSALRNYVDLARPFTLVAPALGFISGALTAVGAAPREPWAPDLLVPPLVGAAMAALLNAGNNALNQIYDLEIDRVNKPKRPLPSGRLTVAQVWRFTNLAYALALALAWLVAPAGRHECFWLVLVAVVCTYIYSVPPLRTKRLGIWANVTIAIPRGVLLKVAGWSSVKTIAGIEPWYIGAIFGLFLLGATTTKDFADMEGDRRGGCRTLPIQYGVRRAAWMISPSFVVPFLMINLGAALHVLTGNFVLLQILGAVMTVYGLYVLYLMLRRPEDLAVEENHVSWAHMYRMMFVAQVGFAIAYLL
jgi:4-hydroxybenzoate polyprenyltransferase